MKYKYLNADIYHSMVKDEFVKDYLASIPDGSSILDVGAGEMPYRKYCGHLIYKSQDFCKYDGEGDCNGIQIKEFNTYNIDIRSDIVDIPLPDKSQDVVLCTEVLEHVINPSGAINEIARILKPGGKLLITVPGTSFLHFSPYHFYTGFKHNYFKCVLVGKNFDVELIKKVGSMYSVTALYLWYIAERVAKVACPSKKSVLFKLILLVLSPFIMILMYMNKIEKISYEGLEAGLIIVAIKKDENSNNRK